MKSDLDFFYNKYYLTSQQIEKYNKYFKLIHKYNKVMNLTGIDDKQGVYLKHFYDSLLLVKTINILDAHLIGDLGSGAGFPGLVLAIYYPQKNFDLIEPIKKRCIFLGEVVKELNLENVQVLNKRSEECPRDHYDIIVSRAVASLNILLELSIPLLKLNGYLLAQKGPKALDEVNEAKAALKNLNCKVISQFEEELPIEKSRRYNLVIQKKGETDQKFPRNYGQIKKNPL